MVEKYITQHTFTNQEDFKTNFKINVPENFNFAYDIVDEWARTHLDKKALCWVNDQGEHIDFTFKDMKEKSDAAADIKAIVCVGESSTMRFPNALP